MIQRVLGVVSGVLKTLYRIPYAKRPLDLTLTWTAAAVRLGNGTFCGVGQSVQPEKTLILYEYEGCPFCKKVREHLCILDLDAEIRPCPRTTFKLHGAVEASSRFRGEAKERGGKAMFPFLIDENTGKDMYQSDAIVDYLWATYGTKKQVPFMVKVADSRLWRMPSLFLVSLLRSVPHMGLMASPSRRPEQPLELWGFEPSPPCKLVRETLCELELPYVQRNCAKGSIKRPEFREKYGHTLSSFRQITNQIKVPLLIDPNTKTELFESADIVSYLRRTYQVGESTDADLSAYSTAKKAY